MKILDWYILKRYLFTFLMMLLLFIPIGITVHLAEKIGKILDKEVPFGEVAVYLYDFTIYFAHLLFPLFLFLSVIWFTSKLANNTEIVAFLSSGVLLGLYLAPKASKGFNDFSYKYLKSRRAAAKVTNVLRQINTTEQIYVSSFDEKSKKGNNFTLEHFKENQLTHKITATAIRFIEKDSVYRLTNYVERHIGVLKDSLVILRRKDTILNFDIKDLVPKIYEAEVLPYNELVDFIDKEELRGSSDIGRYKLVFFDKVFGVMAEQADFDPIIAVWFPNIIFGLLSIYLLIKAKR